MNNYGKKGTNIPLDEATEHSNNFVKQSIKNLGPNLSEAAISRICKAESSTSLILENLDDSLKRHAKSGKDSDPSKERDLQELIKRAQEMNVFEERWDVLIIISVTLSETGWKDSMPQNYITG